MNLRRTVLFPFLWVVFLSLGYGQIPILQDYGPFDPSIPTPQAFLGYEMGEFHTRHDRIVSYFEALAKASDRVQLLKYGETHERRPLLLSTISYPENLKHLKEIQSRHRAQITPGYDGQREPLPLVLYLGYNIHGNEPSSSEAAMLVAYTLAASRNDTLLQWLRSSIILLDPVINPDGRERHTQWVNSRRSKHPVADKYDGEHNEPWPKGRTNHYWFDLNRDLLLAVHPESRGRLEIFHRWYPNVFTDFHEMGTSSTYFFEPKRPSALLHPITPKENHTTLNDLFKREFAREMNRIGDLYYSHEVFDATYPGYGSTYGDLQGGLALLFEQASSRGHVQETPTGPITFAKTIMHQYLMSLTTVRTAVEHRDYLQDYQRRYFEEALRDAREEVRHNGVSGYGIQYARDSVKTRMFVRFLMRHSIEVRYNREGAFPFYVPLEQSQYRLVKHVFQDVTEWADSVFYDASAWNLARAYDIDYSPVRHRLRNYKKFDLRDITPPEKNITPAGFAYVMPWDGYYAPAALFALQKAGIFTRLAQKPFTMETGGKRLRFSRGSIIISVGEQRERWSKEALFGLIRKIARQYQVPFYSLRTGLASGGIDLGSPNAPVLKRPKVALLTGEGVNGYEAGEVWYELDSKMDIALTKIPLRIFSRVPLTKYNVLVMVSGRYYQLQEQDKKRIREWVRQGNTLITLNDACQWAINHHIAGAQTLGKPPADSTQERKPYASAPGDIGSRQVSGVILQAQLDTTHPVGYGYHRDHLSMYKKTGFWLKPGKNPYAMPAIYSKHPLQSGYVSPANQSRYLSKQPASILVAHEGKGRVILFSDDPIFRGTWPGTEKLFLNAIFFGHRIKAYTGSRWWQEE